MPYRKPCASAASPWPAIQTPAPRPCDIASEEVTLFEATSKANTQPEEPLAVSITEPDAKKTVFVPFTLVITSELRCFRIVLAKRCVPLLASASDTGGTTSVPSAMLSTQT